MQKLQRTEHQQKKNQKSYTWKRKAISQTRINQLKAGKRGENAQRSSRSCKKCKKGGEIHHLHTPQRLHSSDASLPPPSSQGVPQYSSRQRTGDELNVNKYPQGVESFVTKKHSWEERGLVISLPEKLYRQEKKDNGRQMGSLGKDLRSGLIICACSPGEGLENSSGGVQQELGQGALRRPISARKPRNKPWARFDLLPQAQSLRGLLGLKNSRTPRHWQVLGRGAMQAEIQRHWEATEKTRSPISHVALCSIPSVPETMSYWRDHS